MDRSQLSRSGTRGTESGASWHAEGGDMSRVEGFPLDPPFGLASPAAVIDLRGIGGTLNRHRFWIALPVLLCGALALLVCLILPIRYEATAKVLVDPRNLQVLQNEINPGAGNGDETELFVQSQLQVVRSTAVLEQVVDDLDLANDPEFGRPAPGPLAQLVETLTGPSLRGTEGDDQARALRALQRVVDVHRPDKTFVVDIGATTGDPEKSARIANGVAADFLKEITRAQGENIERAADALDARLNELGARLRGKEAAVEQYRASKGLVDVNGQLIAQQQLTDLNTQLAPAQARLADQGARLEQIRRLKANGGEPDPATDAQSINLSVLRAAYAQAKRNQEQAALVYGPRHPTTASLGVAAAAARHQLDAELDRIGRAAQIDYDRARATAADIEQRIAALKRDVGVANENGVGLRELSREAASSRAIYETFLNRARDLQERQSLDVVNARVISTAVAPISRAGPSRIAILLGGLIVGLLLGVAAALLRGQFADPVEA